MDREALLQSILTSTLEPVLTQNENELKKMKKENDELKKENDELKKENNEWKEMKKENDELKKEINELKKEDKNFKETRDQVQSWTNTVDQLMENYSQNTIKNSKMLQKTIKDESEKLISDMKDYDNSTTRSPQTNSLGKKTRDSSIKRKRMKEKETDQNETEQNETEPTENLSTTFVEEKDQSPNKKQKQKQKLKQKQKHIQLLPEESDQDEDEDENEEQIIEEEIDTELEEDYEEEFRANVVDFIKKNYTLNKKVKLDKTTFFNSYINSIRNQGLKNQILAKSKGGRGAYKKPIKYVFNTVRYLDIGVTSTTGSTEFYHLQEKTSSK